MIKTVIFDFGGVLVRTEDRMPRQRLAEKFGLSYEEIDQLVYGSATSKLAGSGKISAEEHKETVLKTLKLPPGSFKSFGDEFWGGDRLDKKLMDFIQGLRGEYTTALLSNAWDDLRPMLAEFWKIDGVFDHIFISAELKMAKPDPAIYQHVIHSLNQDASRMVFVDDFIENVLAAREAGMNAIHFRSREQALIELAEILDNESIF
ncbi:MAG: HAD family phosphatase [Anaerolineales bacterium]|nr:MAG: HAD family phosphatase [Anaerolineales bacterium]